MLERSLVTGIETLADGSSRPHSIHFYDVGIGGDGLRGPAAGYDNPFRKFLAHEHAPEIWKGKQLVSGGKHYGHLEVNVALNAEGQWQAELTPEQIVAAARKYLDPKKLVIVTAGDFATKAAGGGE